MVILVFLRALRRYYRSHPGSLRSGEPPLARRHNRPDGFHDPKWPGALQEAVGGSQGARYCEGQDEPWAALFERVTDEHCGNREKAEGCEFVHAVEKRSPWFILAFAVS